MLLFEALGEIKSMQVFVSTKEQKQALEMAQKALEAQIRLADTLNELILDSQNELYENDTYSIDLVCDILGGMRWHDISEEPQEGQFCKFEYLWTRHQKEDSKGQCTGWWTNGKVKWLNMPFDIGRKRVIRWTEAEEHKEKKYVDVRGLCDDGYCPDCGVRLNDLEEECSECGCVLDWTRWKSINEVE